ncbi:DUF6296 family protein [Streptantibioticus ferralitis]|uniref:DUF6296 family protein n=1 Tax=Streptantibioticus ferralitis TaxID=236510 RepID=A0ABT5YWY1_9ACTN|nr:DUF6296 family protein [Streptantibioticus ferralitis]MDF2256064.1 DUF6296 family protein [Streptantibioticus ferralitis]
MDQQPAAYELTFPQSEEEGAADTVVVRRTETAGPGGSAVYTDDSGIIRAEISEKGEVRMLASGGRQALSRPTSARPLD